MNSLLDLFHSDVDAFDVNVTNDVESSSDPIQWMRHKALLQLKSDPAYDLIHQNPQYTNDDLEAFIDDPSFQPPFDPNTKASYIINSFNAWLRNRTAQSDGDTAKKLDEYFNSCISTLEQEMETGWREMILNKSPDESQKVNASSSSIESKPIMTTPSTQLPPPGEFTTPMRSQDLIKPLPVVQPMRPNKTTENLDDLNDDDEDSSGSDDE